MPRFTKERGVTGVLEVRDGPDTVSSAESAPTTSAHGTDCAGFNTVVVAIHTLVGSPTYSLDIWLFEGTAWVQASDGAGAPAVFTDLTATFTQIFNISGFDRVLVRISAMTGTSLDRSYTFVG
jgi:hypothetical protein